MDGTDSGLERMRDLCSRISHDLNNYTGIIQGYLELLRLELCSEDGQGYMDRIEQACKKIVERSLGFQDFASCHKVLLVPLKLDPWLRDLASSYPLVEFRSGVDAPSAAVDPDSLRRALNELLQNAQEASPNQVISLSLFAEADVLVIEVHNPGGHIDPVARRRMFDPLFSTRSSGRGMGLARVHGIVKRHGARLHVTCDDGGVRFQLRLPHTDEAAEELDWPALARVKCS